MDDVEWLLTTLRQDIAESLAQGTEIPKSADLTPEGRRQVTKVENNHILTDD